MRDLPEAPERCWLFVNNCNLDITVPCMCTWKLSRPIRSVLIRIRDNVDYPHRVALELQSVWRCVCRCVCCVWDIDNLKAEWLHDSDRWKSDARARARACVYVCVRARIHMYRLFRLSYPRNLPEMRNWHIIVLNSNVCWCVSAFYLLQLTYVILTFN